MRKSIVLLAVSLLVLCACAERFDKGTEEKAIQTLIDQYHEALGNEDMDTISTLIAHDDDMIVFHAGGRITTGWNEFESTAQRLFDKAENLEINSRNEIIKVHNSGTAAWVSFIQYGSFARNQPVHNWRATWVLEKRNGRWVNVHAHYSGLPAELLDE
ncbi:MAG: nuclear transport factor 2 family protein [Deferribacteres bacterium]|nr:nuclear transport factor 2 family protein [candidate division KSB1 bacterium]MCB9511843.1 nuclear transport factor 2 family protein [Deferribacteres bacterium]